MRVLVTGVKGQLGYHVVQELEKRNHTAIGVDIEEMDITNAEETRNVIENAHVEAVIHCAAYTAVDAAEENVELCRRVNVDGTRNIAEVCGRHQLKMIYISTDYVFDGEGTRPWKPDDVVVQPLNVYGQAKYDGEREVQRYVKPYFIVRTEWVFGENGHNFINTMLRLGKKNGKVGVVADQVGSPTYTRDLAVLLTEMVETDKYGIYHASNEGYCSWYEFTKEIYRQAGMEDVQVTPLTSEEFPAKAKRPHNSRLDKSKLTENGFHLLPPWQDALRRYLKNKLADDSVFH